MITIVKPSYTILPGKGSKEILQSIERAGRVCYKSEDRITDDSASVFVKSIISRGHEAVIEHESLSVHIICDRGVSHEIVRHRLASYCQESTRYCNYGKKGVTFIKPCFWEEDTLEYDFWLCAVTMSAKAYEVMLHNGATPQQARTVLPNSLKTEIIMTCNLREWRHFFSVRCSQAAHPQMREIAIPLLKDFKVMLPEVFDDIQIGE